MNAPANTTASDDEFGERLEIFFGDASDAIARVYARLPRPTKGAPALRLEGALAGPHCMYAETLPATARFADLGPGETLLAEALVPEPCFWSAEMPHQYDADVRLTRAGEVLARARRPFAIRPLAAQGRGLYYQSKRWVLRGVLASEAPKSLERLPLWRQCDAAMVIQAPTDDLCREASRIGVLVIAEVDTRDPQSVASELRRLARWPAVGFAVLRPLESPPAAAALETAIKQVAHNLVLCQSVRRDEPLVPQPWAQLAWCELDTAQALAARLAESPLGVVAMRPAGPLASLGTGRSLCDGLQRDLAGHGESAGYIV